MIEKNIVDKSGIIDNRGSCTSHTIIGKKKSIHTQRKSAALHILIFESSCVLQYAKIGMESVAYSKVLSSCYSGWSGLKCAFYFIEGRLVTVKALFEYYRGVDGSRNEMKILHIIWNFWSQWFQNQCRSERKKKLNWSSESTGLKMRCRILHHTASHL